MGQTKNKADKKLVKTGNYRLETANFLVGLTVLTFELTASRVVAPYIGTTIYTWTSIIGVILAALALGYGLGGYLADRRKKAEDIIILLILAAAFIFALIFFKDSFLSWVSAKDLPLKLEGFIASLVLFSIPTVLLGMTSPYLARLSLVDLATSGRHIARINAAGAIGSLAGVFLAGYVLFDLLGTKNILYCLVLTLLLTTFLLGRKFLFFERILMIGLVVLVMSAYNPGNANGATLDIDSGYQRIIINDINVGGTLLRVLKTDGLGWQSGIYLDGNEDLVFPYTRAFDYVSKSYKDADSFLVIGGGAFTFPAKLARDNPQARVDVVEIDPKLEEISSRYFGFTKPENLTVFNTDGRQYLNSNNKSYDIIYIDAFNSVVAPFQLSTLETTEYIRGSLSEKGIVAVNVISALDGDYSEMAHSLLKTYSKTFQYVEIYSVNKSSGKDNFSQNLILLASDKPLDYERLGPVIAINDESASIFEKPEKYSTDRGILLKDDFAPVENMLPPSL